MRGRILTICSEVPGDAPMAPDPADPLWRMAEVDFGGVRHRVSLACLPDAREGDRVLVHVGMAIALVEDEDDPRDDDAARLASRSAAAPAAQAAT